jgi:hypothetical protein
MFEVAHHQDRRRGPGGGDFAHQCRKAMAVAIDKRQPMTVCSKDPRQLGAYSSRRARDQRHTIGHPCRSRRTKPRTR